MITRIRRRAGIGLEDDLTLLLRLTPSQAERAGGANLIFSFSHAFEVGYNAENAQTLESVLQVREAALKGEGATDLNPAWRDVVWFRDDHKTSAGVYLPLYLGRAIMNQPMLAGDGSGYANRWP